MLCSGFSTGRLKMALNSTLKEYAVNGHISSDGKMIAVDQNYYADYNFNAGKTINILSQQCTRYLMKKRYLMR